MTRTLAHVTRVLAPLVVLLGPPAPAHAQIPVWPPPVTFVTVTSHTPIPGWACIPHPYIVLRDQGWLHCISPEQAPESAQGPTTAPPVQGYEADFANVFLNVSGYAHTFISVKNKADAVAYVTIEVTATGAAPVTRDYTLQPGEKLVPVRLNEWLELAGVGEGVAVVVRSTHPLSASAALHPGNPVTYYTGARVLEGR